MNHSIFALSLFLLSMLSLSQSAIDKIRCKAVSAICSVLPDSSRLAKGSAQFQELKSLQLENQQLRNQLDLVYEWLDSEKRLKEQLELFQLLSADSQLPKTWIARRSEEFKALLQKQAMAAFGRMIYRDPSSWSSSCWIDVGEENNAALGQTIIAKNSPIVSGSALIGVIEYVGKRQSRVRLITDSGLKTAVRAVRGSILEREIATLAHNLLEKLQRQPKRNADFIAQLAQFEKTLPLRWEDAYFAKGEIMGNSASYFRSLQPTLKGIGFNYDFPDAEGPTRDLRSNILQEGDVLVTSGLDGVFPPGLKVGIVTKIKPLSAGAFCYELEASPAAKDLSDITTVCVLPPVGLD